MSMKIKFLKTVLCTVLVVLLVSVLSGCGSVIPKENIDVKQLKQSLSKLAQESAKTYFNKEIQLKDYKISLAEETAEDNFETLTTTKTQNNVYLIGYHKSKPEDVMQFVMIYDMSTGSIIKFGIQTLADNEIVYAKLNN